MAPKFISANGVEKPQSLSFIVNEPDQQGPSLVTIYTGILLVDHGEGDDLIGLDIQYPVVNATRQLQPFAEESRFGRAVACVSLASFRFDSERLGGVCAVNFADVNLHYVTLNSSSPKPSSPPQMPLVAVLSANLAAQNSEVHRISYQITVVTRNVANIPPPLELDPLIWDGGYSEVGPIIKRGDPEP